MLLAPDGSVHTLSREHGRGCNNEAEAHALIAALTAALELGARQLVIHCDSDVVVQHVVGSKRTTVARLAPLFERARALVACFARVQLELVPRHRNVDADVLARAAVGLPPKSGKRAHAAR